MDDDKGKGATIKAKILIVDDHPIVREGLTARLNRQPDLEVCGEAEDVAEALEQVKKLSPDLVLVDLSLKSGEGLDLIKRIKARSSTTKMLVSSVYDETLYAERALHAGASGYINKQEITDKLIEAIRQVLSGKVYLSTKMVESLLQRAVGQMPQPGKSLVEALTNRELEIFRKIGQGMTTRQIAKHLHLSVKTVESHREHIKEKLHLHNTAELAREAIRWVLENG
jgi:DNA-binding NarL/FixJ family response regulator